MPDDKAKPRRDYLVEVLRFWACMIVVCHHFFCQFLPRGEFASEPSWILPDAHGYDVGLTLYHSPLFNLFSAGSFAVALFFILSGYILAKPYFHKKTLDFASLGGDIIKRIFRLGLPLWIIGVVSLICVKFAIYEHNGVAMGRVSGSGWGTAFFQKPGMADFDWLHVVLAPFLNVQDVLSPTWTILTELLGSYLTYCMVAILFYSSRVKLIGLLTVLCAPDYYKLFALGTLYAYGEANVSDEWKRRWKRFKRFRLSPFIGLGLFWLFMYIASYPGNNIPSSDCQQTMWKWLIPLQDFFIVTLRLSPGCTFVAATGLFVVTKLWCDKSSILKFFAPLGKYTYIIYLVHFVLLGTVVSWFYLTFCQQYSPVIGIVESAVVYVLAIVACCFLEPAIDGNAIKWSHQIKLAYIKSLNLPVAPTPQTAPTPEAAELDPKATVL